jgi:HTH-type transcriptional regulator, cell division transcriptional repressor
MGRDPGRLVAVVQRRIRELRRERGLTQAQLCERAGISVDAVTRIEGGKRTPTLDTVEQLAAALGVAPTAFFEGVPPPEENAPSSPLRRVMTLLEQQPDEVLTLAEKVVNAVVRGTRTTAAPASEGRTGASVNKGLKQLGKSKRPHTARTRRRT